MINNDKKIHSKLISCVYDVCIKRVSCKGDICRIHLLLMTYLYITSCVWVCVRARMCVYINILMKISCNIRVRPSFVITTQLPGGNILYRRATACATEKLRLYICIYLFIMQNKGLVPSCNNYATSDPKNDIIYILNFFVCRQYL